MRRAVGWRSACVQSKDSCFVHTTQRGTMARRWTPQRFTALRRLRVVIVHTTQRGTMARRWTPQRFTALRRLRVVICALATFALCATFFLCTTRKAVALSVNGETRHVTTYAHTQGRGPERERRDTACDDLRDHSDRPAARAGRGRHDARPGAIHIRRRVDQP